ncbi:MAG: MerR family transcriptional regulator [Caulobacter sp.]|nr:MerR family transcriptional regulator [Caulobacter sp.]
MKIGELARRSGFTPSRIRFYEASGLIGAAERHPNGYRHYAPDTVWLLELIATAQSAGFSLEEIRKLLPVGPDGLTGRRRDELLASLRARVAEIERLQARLDLTRTHLLATIADIEGRQADGDCAGNARRVLERLREDGVVARR